MTRHIGYQPGDVFTALESEPPLSALFTTFTFSPGTFQQEYLIPLLHRGCANVTVLVDAIGYAQSLFSAATAQSIGTDYRLRQVWAEGAFHGKLVVIRTRHAAFVGVGSGNLTAPGLQTNAEVGGLYRLDQADQLDVLAVVVARLRNMALIEDAERKPVQPIQLTGDARLMTSLDVPILGQLDLPSDVSRIEIISPFVDGQHEVLAKIKERWPHAKIRMRLDPEFGALSESLLARASDRVSIQVPIQTDEGRPLVHGKLVCFIGSKSATVVLGSANLSRPALLTTENFEAVVERRMKPDEVYSLLSVPQIRWRKREPMIANCFCSQSRLTRPAWLSHHFIFDGSRRVGQRSSVTRAPQESGVEGGAFTRRLSERSRQAASGILYRSNSMHRRSRHLRGPATSRSNWTMIIFCGDGLKLQTGSAWGMRQSASSCFLMRLRRIH